MAKISFTKLGLKINQEIKTIEYNGQNIEVKQYLPIQDKLKLIGDVIMNSAEQDTNFANPIKANIYKIFGIIENYTNINFTEKQKEDPAKLYDIVVSSGLVEAVLDAIPEAEYNTLIDGIWDSVNAVYSYKNSVFGILDTISTDYSNLNLDVTEIQQKLADPENMGLLRQVMTKLG